jgi:hypothetical protein
MDRHRYLGVDPGASGGLAVLDEAGAVLLARATPETDQEQLALVRAFTGMQSDPFWNPIPTHAVLERVWSSPQMGVASAFKFGLNVGAWRMALAALKIPFDEVVPQKWQTAMGCRTGGGRLGARNVTAAKNLTKRRATALFPTVKVTHAIADALLIAEFCRRLHLGAQGHTEAPRGLFDGEEDEARKTGVGVWDEDREEVDAPQGAAEAATEGAAGDGRPRHRGDREGRTRIRRRA